jgi:hypothetical protein
VERLNNNAKKNWADGLALLALAALTLVFFWKIALTNRVLVGLDLFAYFYPYRDYASEMLLSGQLPLWNPYLFMGAPFLANSQAAVLYPIHWPLLWLSAPKQIAWSIVIHIWLAGAGTYIFSRTAMRLRPLAAFAAALTFALGGFLGAQVEHINQLNASAWLPWLLLCLHAATVLRAEKRWVGTLCGGGIVGLILLAGHTQAAYIVLFGAAVYALLGGLQMPVGQRRRRSVVGLAILAGMGGIGAVLAAGQLLPTLELARFSVRSGGLLYNEAASFSLKPGLVAKALLPPLLWEAPFSEYVAYVGLLGIVLLAIGAWVVVKQRRRGIEVLGLALLGLFLAFGAYNPVYYVLYRFVPGFDLFRVPARWLLLYSFGGAILAGIGLGALPRVKALKPTILVLLILELFVAGQRLAYADPTASIAFDSMRTAPSHLLADSSSAPFRFLSMSDIGYDPGDLEDLEAMYADSLSDEAIYDLIVATKMKEVLAFNLPLRYRLFSVDGYDGGLLPVSDYVMLERLFLDEEDIWPDGRLRQQLRRIPPSDLLSLLNVKYVMTDKTQDVWIDDIFYDLEHTMPLGSVTITDVPEFPATHIGIVSYLTNTTGISDNTMVAQVIITSTSETSVTLPLLAGMDTAEGLYNPQTSGHHQARIGHAWRDNGEGSDYLAVLELGKPLVPQAITVRSTLPDEQVQLRGLTLIDGNTGNGRNLSIDPTYSLVHSGDVKIYENHAALPRAFIVHEAIVSDNDEQALDVLQGEDFNLKRSVVLSNGRSLETSQEESNATITRYDAHHIELQAKLDTSGYLVLTDTFYPGWTANVDGNPATIRRADLYFRAIALEPGEHKVTLRYRPKAAYLGIVISLVSWLTWGLILAIMVGRIGRKSPSSV